MLSLLKLNHKNLLHYLAMKHTEEPGKICIYVSTGTTRIDFTSQFEWLIDCMVFNAVFNSISVISRQPVHLSMLSWSSFKQYSAEYSFQATGCFPTQPLAKQWTVVGEKWILSQWLSSILRKNIGQARDQISAPKNAHSIVPLRSS